MSYLANILIPLVLAVFLGILFQPILKYLKAKGINQYISLVIILLMLLGAVTLFGTVVSNTLNQIIGERHQYLELLDDKTSAILHAWNKLSGNDFNFTSLVQDIISHIDANWALRASGYLLAEVGDSTEVFLLTSVFLIFLIDSIMNYPSYIAYLIGQSNNRNHIIERFEVVKKSIVKYIIVKAVASFSMSVLFGLTALSFNLDFAYFWAFITFFMYFIPTVGAFVVTIPVMVLAYIQLSFPSFIILTSILFVGQFVIANLIEPRYLGNSVSLSPVSILVGLIFWGYSWGIIGMVLSVPILIVIREILKNFPDFNFFVRLISKRNS
ncbi:membrane protein (plasmid) [Aureibacter tunicatorum]|nr:membrane protein [Aureibacter tunicatorum]